MHSLAPIAGITSVSGSISHAEAAVVEAGERLAELLPPAVRGVLLVAVLGHRRLHRLDHVLGVGMSGSPIPRLITSMPAALLSRDLPLELGEHVGRHRLEALGRIREGHGSFLSGGYRADRRRTGA